MNVKKDLIELVEMIIDNKTIGTQRKYEMFNKYFWVGEVDVVSGVDNTATVLLPNQSNATQPKQNKTGQTLVNGDNVLLFSPYGTLGSAFIAWTFKKYLNGGGGSGISDTDDLSEGAVNLYFTNERAQDAVGSILQDTSSINFTYDDSGNIISATVINNSHTHTEANITDLKSYEQTSNKGIAGGYASLDGTGKLTSTQVPTSILESSDIGSTVQGYDADTVIDGSYVHTDNNFTNTLKSKLDGISTGAEVNNISDVNATDLTDGGDSALHYHSSDRSRANHTGTQSADTIVDGTTNKAYTATEQTKLSNIDNNANNYTHPSYDGDDINIDTGALTGATVVSDIDINVTTDALGHVTDANGVVSTRTLTLADLGYDGEASTADSIISKTDTGTANSYVVNTNGTFDLTIDGNTLSFIPINSNTGASAIVVDSQASKAIKKYGTTNFIDLQAEDIKKYNKVDLVWSVSNGFFIFAPKVEGGIGNDKTIQIYAGGNGTVLDTTSVSSGKYIYLNKDSYVGGTTQGSNISGSGSLITDGVVIDGANAFDNNTGTRCNNITRGTGYIGKDFGSGNEQEIGQFAVAMMSLSGSPLTFDLVCEASQNNSTWVTLGEVSQTVNTTYALVTANSPSGIAYRYYRVRLASGGSTTAFNNGCYEVKWYPITDGQLIPSTDNAYVSTQLLANQTGILYTNGGAGQYTGSISEDDLWENA